MRNWTSGPWTAVQQNDKRHRCVPVMAESGGKQDNGPVLVASCANHHVDWPTAEANAHLIAAAPDLVDALADILSGWQYIRRNHGDLYGVGWDRAEEKAVAALAKARGQSVQNSVQQHPDES